MIALTSKLNERDENIIQLQEEIEAYEKINKDLEDSLESKNIRIEAMDSYMKKNGLKMDELNLHLTKTITSGSRKEKTYVPYQVEKNEIGNTILNQNFKILLISF
jgi:kinesin family protein 3/17